MKRGPYNVKERPYECRSCDENDRRKFYEGRRTKCRRCYNSQRSVSHRAAEIEESDRLEREACAYNNRVLLNAWRSSVQKIHSDVHSEHGVHSRTLEG